MRSMAASKALLFGLMAWALSILFWVVTSDILAQVQWTIETGGAILAVFIIALLAVAFRL